MSDVVDRPGQLDIFDPGEARKRQGMAVVDANAAADWKALVDDAARQMVALTSEPWTTYDLKTRYDLPEPHHPNAWGARMSALAKAGVIVSAGYGQSKRPTTAKSIVHLWRAA